MSSGRRGKDKAPRLTAARKQAAVAAGSGLTPLEYMLGIMRDESAETPRRDDMAKAAAPYIHAKLASVQHSGDAADPITVVIRRLSEDDVR